MTLKKLTKIEETPNFVFIEMIYRTWLYRTYKKITIIYDKVNGIHKIAESGENPMWLIEDIVLEAFVESKEKEMFFNN